MRADGRRPDQMRPVEIQTGYLLTAEGSALIEVGSTRVLCAASVEQTVPQFLRGSGKGWVTAEYAMLPRATVSRSPRESVRPSGRTQEIQRLIGRSLRSVVDLAALGERTAVVGVGCQEWHGRYAGAGGRGHTAPRSRTIHRCGAV